MIHPGGVGQEFGLEFGNYAAMSSKSRFGVIVLLLLTTHPPDVLCPGTGARALCVCPPTQQASPLGCLDPEGVV